MTRDVFKNIEIDGERYFIKKFDAMTGLQIARLLLAKAAPIVPLIEKVGSVEGEAAFAAIGGVLETLSDDDMKGLVQKCLRVCSRIMPAGPQQIMDDRGNYGGEDVEYDFLLVIKLCVEAIKWGASDFFGGKPRVCPVY